MVAVDAACPVRFEAPVHEADQGSRRRGQRFGFIGLYAATAAAQRSGVHERHGLPSVGTAVCSRNIPDSGLRLSPVKKITRWQRAGWWRCNSR